MSTVATVASVAKAAPRVRTKTSFYVALSLFMVGIVLVGFWPTYFGRLLRGDVARPAVIQIHGIVIDHQDPRR